MSDTVNFSLFAALSRRSDGGVVIASNARNNLQFFDARGRRIKTVGRSCRGPGEFDGIWSLSRTSDTLVVLDRTGIPHLFSVAGSYLRSDPVIANPATTLGEFPPLELTRAKNGRPRANLYAPRNRVTVLSDHVCTGYAGGVTISCFDQQWRKVGTATLRDVAPVSVTKADEEAWFNDIYEANVGDAKDKLDRQVRLERERRTFARSMGYFGSLIASRDDLLWVGPPSTADSRPFVTNVVPSTPTTWRVFRPNGSPVATVSLPARFRLVEAGGDYVAGITADSDGAEVVLVYRLAKR